MRTPNDIKVLVACEESQTVCKAFRDRGFNAWSCDLQDSSNENEGLHPYHIKGDALRALRSQDWDVVIAFPPCTYLSNAGARYLYKGSKDISDNKLITLASGKKVITERYNKGLKGKEFFLALLNCKARYVAIENPRPDHAYELPEPSQIICPSQYGHAYTKTTHLWLKGLPCLVDTKPQNKQGLPSYTNLKRSPKSRSKFHSGFASAMACQWGDHILKTINDDQIHLLFDGEFKTTLQDLIIANNQDDDVTSISDIDLDRIRSMSIGDTVTIEHINLTRI